jgi:hypothetical protein
MVVLPATFAGSPRHMNQFYQDSMALVRKFGKPDLFITMTCNPNWLEILHELRLGEEANDRPNLTSSVATPLWDKCEGEAHAPKSGKSKSSGTLKNSELEFRGQISLHSNALYVIGKVLKCTCLEWPRMSHLDICSPSYGQKKGRESNW